MTKESRVLQTEFFGDPNIGLFAKACDKVCVLGRHISERKAEEIKKIVRVDTFIASITNSEIVGIFCAMNSNGIVLPKIARQDEIKNFKKIMSNHGISVGVVKSKFTALGNLILCNDNGAMLSKLLSPKDKKTIEDFLDVETDYSTVAGLDSIGSCGIATNSGCVLHRDSTEEELNKFQDMLHVDTDIGTANFGSPFVGSCAVANTKGVIVGEKTTGPEVARIMETLQLL